ncbi:Uncharacterised protein [Mycobacteroides abscessus subsp. abscessus]|nr:Uncharacterised protein [Mycobacteroides abscessus subsp. abscessus]
MKRAPAKPVAAEAINIAGRVPTNASIANPAVRKKHPATISGLYPNLSASVPPTRNMPC